MGLCHRSAAGFEVCELAGGSAGGDCSGGPAIGVDPAYIVASAPACYGYYILPTYPSDLAAIQFDRSGTTHIGRFVINHSFILPGLIGVGVSCVFGWVFAAMYGFL